VTLAVRSTRVLPALEAPSRFGPFMPRAGADIYLTAAEAPVPTPDPRDLLFDSGGTWRVYRRGAGLLYAFRPPMGDGPPARGVVIDRRRRRGRLYLPPPYGTRRGFGLSYPLDELIFQHHLAHAGGLVVHACGLAVEGKAVLFCGASGAGKSTMARLWLRHHGKVRILSDDRIVLRRRGASWWAYGTPWHGSARLASPASRRLAALFFIEKAAARNSLERLGPGDAAARLFSHSFPPPWEAVGTARALASAARLGIGVPSYLLRFRREAGTVATVRQVLGKLTKG
jgi:hypothetical protein